MNDLVTFVLFTALEVLIVGWMIVRVAFVCAESIVSAWYALKRRIVEAKAEKPELDPAN